MKPALLLTLVLVCPLTAQQLFVDANRGSDANTGSAASPFRSIGRALAGALPGWRIWIRSGVYGTQASGETLPLVIGGARNHANVVLEGIGAVTLDLQHHVGAGIRVERNAAGLRLVNLRFHGGNPASLRSVAIEAGSATAPDTANDVVVERCTFLAVQRGIALWRTHDGQRPSRWVVHHCRFDGVATDAIDEPDATAGNVLVHNTIVACRGIGLLANGGQSVIESNIVVGNLTGVLTTNASNPSRFANNDVWANGTDWAGIAAPPGNLSFDPLFADASRRLSAGSTLIDVATTVAITQRLDLDGNPGVVAHPRLQADIGAFERNETRLVVAHDRDGLAMRMEGRTGVPAAILFSLGDGLIQLPGQSPIALNPNSLLGALTGTLPMEFRTTVLPVAPDVHLVTQGIALPPSGPLDVSNAVSLWGDLGSSMIQELFADDAQQDRVSSSGTWGNGSARPGLIGGDGELGDFDPTDGRVIGAGVYEWSTDNQTIPARRTLHGRPVVVTDGVFRFASFVLPAGVTVRFIGSKPVRLYVRGTMDVQGTLANSGTPMNEHAGGTIGQPGGAGGAGGGRGGKGGDSGNGQGVQQRFHGGDGEDVRLVQGHAWAQRAVGTGGRGSLQFPLDGLNASITWGYFNFYSVQISAGGAGGGNATTGAPGRAVSTYNNRTQDMGPPAPGGVRFDPFPYAGPLSTLDHFLIGGAGGGGSGSHPFFSLELPRTYNWRSGSGGAGGGGALAARVGGDLLAATTGRMEVLGGRGNVSGNVLTFPGAGGGGSGGALVLQAGGNTALRGTIDLSGGPGGANRAGVYNLDQSGGTGGAGVVRLEIARGTPDVRLLGTTVPPQGPESVDSLTGGDDVVGDQSRWYPSNRPAAPQWLRYEMDVDVGAARLRFSDDPSRGIAAGPGQPVRLYVQGANVDPLTRQAPPATIAPWRSQVGRFVATEPSLNDDRPTGARFVIVFDRTVAQAEVKRVALFYR